MGEPVAVYTTSSSNREARGCPLGRSLRVLLALTGPESDLGSKEVAEGMLNENAQGNGYLLDGQYTTEETVRILMEQAAP